MKLTFLGGTGGAMPTPRPFCGCEVCEQAREYREPYKRNSSSFYVEEALAVVDCPEDIGDSLNRRRIMNVENLFITHWHPDHTFGLRPILEANYDFIKNEVAKPINLYIPNKVYDQLYKVYPNFYYFEHIAKMCIVHKLDHKESVRINDCNVTAIGFEGSESSTYGYLFEHNGKRVLYAPCDTIAFNYEIEELDLLVNECGILSPEVETEISFDVLLNTVSKLNIKKTILTHIEEIEVQRFGMKYFESLKKKYSEVDFEYAFDGMTVEL